MDIKILITQYIDRVNSLEKELINLKCRRAALQELKILEGSGNSVKNLIEFFLPSNQRFTNMSIGDAAFEIYKEIGKNHANVVFEKIVAGGKIVRGVNPKVTVAATLRQDKRFENFGRNVYDIAVQEVNL